jgi:hypothetical protein
MANHVTNDRGENVVAIGAPGSLERVKCERPELINHIAHQVRLAGITSRIEQVNVLRAAIEQLSEES